MRQLIDNINANETISQTTKFYSHKKPIETLVHFVGDLKQQHLDDIIVSINKTFSKCIGYYHIIHEINTQRIKDSIIELATLTLTIININNYYKYPTKKIDKQLNKNVFRNKMYRHTHICQHIHTNKKQILININKVIGIFYIH